MAAPVHPDLATKGDVVEEWVDLHFFRPIGIRIARALAPTHVTADQVTLWSLLIGLVAGHCFVYTSPWLNALGLALFVLSDLFDSADGQLARLRGTSTRFGRILDGLSDNARFVNLYVHVIVRLVIHDSWWWPWAVLLAVAAGVSHSYQSAAIDCIRHSYLEIGVGRGSELELPEDLAVPAPGSGVLQRIGRAADAAYAAYVRRQVWLCGTTMQLARRLRQMESGAAAVDSSTIARVRAEYRSSEAGTVKQCAWLGQNIRFLLVGVPGMLGWIAGFLWLTLLPLNAILVVLLVAQEKNAGRILHRLNASPRTHTSIPDHRAGELHAG